MAGKGSRYERELVERFNERGFLAFRMGSSGGGTADDRVDVLAGRPWATKRSYVSAVVGVEAKFIGSGRDRVSLNVESDLEQPQAFVDAFGGEAYVGLRWSRDTTWYFRSVQRIEAKRGADSVSFTKSDMENWKTIENITL